MREIRKSRIPKTRCWRRHTYPPLNLPSVRQATSRERPAPMIKLVGFNISGIPKRNDRDDRRNNTKRMSKQHRKSGTGKWVKAKQRSETQRRKRPGVTAADPTTNEENYRVPRMGRLVGPCLGTERPRETQRGTTEERKTRHQVRGVCQHEPV